jgi:hypothetical protein
MSEATERGTTTEAEVGENEICKLVMAGLAGAVAGAVVGLMLAPERGAEIRRRIRETILTCCSTCRERLRPLLRCACGGDADEEAAEGD